MQCHVNRLSHASGDNLRQPGDCVAKLEDKMSDDSRVDIPSIHAYFSHSYRKEDRDVNRFFWKLFNDEAFFFTIDPKSTDFIIPQLERMMRFSDCFIAVVTHRLQKISKIDDISLEGMESTYWTHSPYIAFENFLAELASKPRLLFVENDLELDVFGTNDVYPFDRILLDQDKNYYREIVQRFAKRVRISISFSKQNTKSAYTRRAGVLLEETQDPTGYTLKMINSIKNTLRKGGYSSELISYPLENGLQDFLRKLADLELVVIDVQNPRMAAEALAIIQAKAIPSIKISKYDTEDKVETLRANGLLKDYFIGDDIPVILWKSPGELIANMWRHLSKFSQARTPLTTYEQGNKYFISAGRKPAKIFISNAESLNKLALPLVQELQTLNIQYFQYQSNSGIEVGTVWEEELKKELEKCNIFIALINDEYHRSPYCQMELRTAFDRWSKDRNKVTILPYICEKTEFPDLIKNTIQIRDVHANAPDTIVKMVSEKINELLDREEEKDAKIDKQDSTTPGNQITILFLASNPEQTAYLNLTREVEEIDQKIRSSEFRDKLRLEKHFEQKPGDLQENLLRYKPTIVHFSGHGESTGELLLMDTNGRPIAVSVQAFKLLFSTLTDNVRVILLNACYSKEQAASISDVIDFVIGMNLPISDEAAIAFSAAFYRAIGYGRTIQKAFDSARTEIALFGMPEEDTPQLFVRNGADVSTRLINS
jgi:hypothetical protein